jgi:hypothetical protein
MTVTCYMFVTRMNLSELYHRKNRYKEVEMEKGREPLTLGAFQH